MLCICVCVCTLGHAYAFALLGRNLVMTSHLTYSTFMIDYFSFLTHTQKLTHIKHTHAHAQAHAYAHRHLHSSCPEVAARQGCIILSIRYITPMASGHVADHSRVGDSMPLPSSVDEALLGAVCKWLKDFDHELEHGTLLTVQVCGFCHFLCWASLLCSRSFACHDTVLFG